jgi:ketosteroid isomerase-like protein
MSAEADRLARLAAVLDGFNAHDADAIVAHFTEDCVFEKPRGPDACGQRLEGKEAVRAGFAERFEGLPDVHYESHGDFVSGDRGVSEWTISGTLPGGERLEVRGCDLWTFAADGRISVKNSFWKIRE